MTAFRAHRDAALTRHAWVPPTALVIGTMLVFAAHFRPWEVAFLEEWPLAADWNGNGGWAFAPNYLEWTLSRPLHLIPSLIGLAVANGAPGGIFLILGLVAAAQVPVIVWALRPVSRSIWLSGSVALFLALHPLWPGGYLQRFLPAQTAVLALALAVGLLIRWLQSGRVRWIIWACVVLLLGFLVYPGPAVAAPLMALAVALVVKTTWKRRIWAVAAVTTTSAVMTVYSLVITRLISPSGTSYEMGNIEVAGVRSLRELVTYVQATLFSQGELVLLGVLAVGVLGAVLALAGAIPHPAGWLITGIAFLSPVTTIVYFGHTGWLSDIGRLGYVISLGLFVALLVWPIASTGRRIRLEVVLAAALVALSAIGGARGIQYWQPYIETQHRLLDALGPVVREAGEGEVVVVVDHSGTFGLERSFPLQYLASASRVWNDDDTPVWLCFEEPSPVPGGAVLCDPEDTGEDLRLMTTLAQPTGTVNIYIGQKEPK
ncbi:hypothetical protein [Microbacterium terregens]|uniref:Glycosyltransferase RgtA/B/C/D-like domain-containing protein n=1 Tax=Microbacterium terregens TaxID=69363 RepID=A0ABV5SZM1_9MICO